MTEQATLTNALRILFNLDWLSEGFEDELGMHMSRRELEEFLHNPARFYLRADDETQERIWGLITKRMPKRVPVAAE